MIRVVWVQVMATPQSQPMRGGIEVMVTGECAAFGLKSTRPCRFRSPRRGVVGGGVQPATAPKVVAQKLCLASQSTIAAAAAGASTMSRSRRGRARAGTDQRSNRPDSMRIPNAMLMHVRAQISDNVCTAPTTSTALQLMRVGWGRY